MSDEHACPTCGRDDFTSDRGMKVHHSKAHGESIAGVEQTCEQCGSAFRALPYRADEAKYCSYDCRNESYRVDRIEKTCGVCGHVFERVPSRANERVCGIECRNELISQIQSQKTTLSCEICGDDFDVPPSHRRRRFCSIDCKSEWQSKVFSGPSSPTWKGGRVELDCELCGAAYQTPACNADESRFCSHDCAWESNSIERSGEDHPDWAGGPAPYGPGWNGAKKEAVRKTQNRRCDGCGMLEADQLEEFGRKLPVHHKQKARDFDDPEKRNRIDNLAALCDNCHPVAERMAPLYPFAD